jgi:ParB family chromosome partitioning protein
MFDPDELVIVEDKKRQDMYDKRVEEPVDDLFVANIEFYGIIQPIVVRKNTETGKTEVLAGRRRVRAARLVNQKKRRRGESPLRVPAVVRRSDPAKSLGIILSENEGRKADSASNRADKASRMLEMGATEEEVALALFCSPATVKNLLALKDAPSFVRDLVDAGRASASEGYKLAKMPVEQAKEAAKKLVQLAPRTSGKKRSGNGAKKVREIISGKPEPEKPVRTSEQIRKCLEDVERGTRIDGAQKHAVKAFGEWLLGDDEVLGELLDVLE